MPAQPDLPRSYVPDTLVFETVEPDLGWPCYGGECLRCGQTTFIGYVNVSDVLRVLENHRARCRARDES
jgi:hypothetical protein